MQHDFSLVFETDNEYWQKVLDIFERNEKYEKKIVSNRNLHHKFPRSFSKKLGEEVDNDKDNLISLSLADHFLVHYYYYLLAKKGFRQAMATAFTFMAKKSLKYITPDTAEAIAKDYAEAKEISMQAMIGDNNPSRKYGSPNKGKKLGPLSEERKQKLSEANKGKVKTAEQRKNMSEAKQGSKNPMFGKTTWNKGIKGELSHAFGHKVLQETREKIRNCHLSEFGRKYFEHYQETRRETDNKKYMKEYCFYKKFGKCSWE